MGMVFYLLAIHFYWWTILIYSTFNLKARLFTNGRRRLFEELAQTNFKEGKRIWFHASSLGEFEQGRPIIEATRANYPDLTIVLTFFSPSGYELRKDYSCVDYVFYLPIDTISNARRFIQIIQPDAAIFIKYDFWLNHLNSCFQQKIPVIFISTKLRSNQFYFNFGRFLYKKYFKQVNHFFVQDDESESILRRLGIDQVTVVGDSRIDRVSKIALSPGKFPGIEHFTGNYDVMICGSTWPSDMEVLSPFIEEMRGKIKFVIAPHNVNEKNIKVLNKQIPKSIRYSQMDENDRSKTSVMIIDNIGMLSSIYSYAKYAFVGGGFNGELHNILEPAAHGIPVFFGDHKNNKKFPEASELVNEGGGIAISGIKDLLAEFSKIEKDENKYHNMSMASSNYISSKLGATDKIMSYLEPLIK